MNDDDLVALPESAPALHAGDVAVGHVDGSMSMTATVYLAGAGAVDGVTKRAAESGLTVDLALAPDAVRVSGPATAIEHCFGVHLSKVRTADGTTAIVPDGAVLVPAAIAKDVVAVLGLDTRPAAQRRDGGTD
jgi:hypothetical protein